MMNGVFASDPRRTAQRARALDEYFDAQVLREGACVCAFFARCRASHAGLFYAAQSHHLGDHYDLFVDGIPLRIVIVGQEYGHGPACVTRAGRTAMLRAYAHDRRFVATSAHKARNPHIRGTTSLLRLLLGGEAGTDYAGEWRTLHGTSGGVDALDIGEAAGAELADPDAAVAGAGAAKRQPARTAMPTASPSTRGSWRGVSAGANQSPVCAERQGSNGQPGRTVHIFEAFALLDFLLCSAVSGEPGTSLDPHLASFRGGHRGQASRVMWEGCTRHFRHALDILEPTLIIVQGLTVRRRMAAALDGSEPLDERLPLERVRLGERELLLASFTHPSAPSRKNWGMNASQPYLVDVVAPTIRAALARVRQLAPGDASVKRQDETC